MRALLKEADLLNEFWLEALLAGIYLRNRIGSGPEINELKVTLEEGFIGLKPDLYYLRTWGYKMYSFISSKSLLERTNKLMDRGRVGVLLGYVDDTIKQYQMWAPDIRAAIKVSANSVRFSEDERVKHKDLGLKITSTPNTTPIRNPVGRPPKSAASSATSSATSSQNPELPKSVTSSTTSSQPKPEVQRRVLSHVEIPITKQRPEGSGQQHQGKDNQSQPKET